MKEAPQQQMTLGVHLRDDATFANYLGDHNREIAMRLRQAIGAPQLGLLFLCGDAGTGKSHLLQAACLEQEQRGGSSLCLSLEELVLLEPEALQGLEVDDLICLDGLEHLRGKEAWQEAFFHLFNRIQDAGRQLFVGSRFPPGELALELADIQSRLASGLVLQLARPRDEDFLEILGARAARRGLSMPDEVAQYILRRAPRDAGALLELLDRLDSLSLQHQRRLTVPFVKQAMSW
ncbi:DnaA regulatory inactivator Hda [Mangrovitalea sediminis]|uniref:DnaA regulatory inactivator Hda n=1 Tax=Mangrovitalea sediminis TaxID=1982043 RepID=UPI000BE52552|nr:DnaA regulatory inactivator Hda [Mangrovitalea sediminis]